MIFLMIVKAKENCLKSEKKIDNYNNFINVDIFIVRIKKNSNLRNVALIPDHYF